MKCPYCQQEMIEIRHTPSAMNSLEIWVYECQNHLPVLFRATDTSPRYMQDFGSLIIPIKERWYCINLNGNLEGSLGDPKGFTIEELEPTDDTNTNFSSKGKVIQISKNRFTPDNAIDKLKTILVFM